MTGRELQQIIKSSKINVTDLIKKTGIIRGTFFSLYNKPMVEDYYLELIEKSGIRLGTPESKGEIQLNKDLEIKRLKDLLQDKQDVIDNKNRTIEQQSKLIDQLTMIVENNKVITK